MKISVSKHAGFCDGVERAFRMVTDLVSKKTTKKPIYVLGSLVHNKDVVEKIEEMGVRRIKVTASLINSLQKISSKIGTLVITAHGMGPKIYELCQRKKIDLVDTTCPKVIKVQRLAKVFADKGYHIVIIGEKDHKEVKGINEWSGDKAIFLETLEDLKRINFEKSEKILVISQTTQNDKFVHKASNEIKKRYPQAQVIDTVCLATHDRQNEVREMAKNNEIMLVIGSPDSANSTRLWEISKKINPRSYFIERVSQIKNEWLKDVKKIGVSAGASTPPWIISEVIDYLKKIN